MSGRPRVHHRLTDSTNERAKALAQAGAPGGTIVTADEQGAGRGRHGRVWTAAPGDALLLSVVVRELEPRHALLPLMAALAVCEASEAVADGERCAIKWPNDVWIGERKLSGILVEGRPAAGWAVVGIGINVAAAPPTEERSVALRSGSPAALLDALLPRLDAWIDASEDAVVAAWRERDALLGRKIGWDGGEGTAAGIDATGALLVDTTAGRVKLDAGEVHLQRVGG